ncbi:MAG: universal stress protein [Methanomicrobiales archaeon]|nr:universal stress protein [Methanomicrobiales archaeon]
MISTILVGIDGSPFAEQALRMALEWAKGWSAAVHAIFVMRPEDLPGLPSSSAVYEGRDTSLAFVSRILESEGAEVEQRVQEIAGRYAWPVAMHKEVGDPAREIIACAKKVRADLIVVGSRGTGTFERFFLGSVSSYVVEHSPVSAVVVKEKGKSG